MVDGTERNDEAARTDKEEIFSKSVRAGKRTYFFDVKTTRRNDYYLTLTESKKKFNRDGRFYFEKHKIFLYKEDFEKFSDGLAEVIQYIKANAPKILDPIEPEVPVDVNAEKAPAEVTKNETTEAVNEEVDEAITENFSNVEFEDLEDKKES
jgi:hypothetical protein